MSDIIFKILIVVLPLMIMIMATSVSNYLIPYLREKLGSEKFNQIKEWAGIAVKCAEMIYNEKGMGKTKKTYVEEFLKNVLKDLDISISDDRIDAIIESCVKEMKLQEGTLIKALEG